MVTMLNVIAAREVEVGKEARGERREVRGAQSWKQFLSKIFVAL